jgi:hypothetical protein
MDRLTSALLADFSKEYELENKTEDKQFEAFATFLAVSQAYTDSFEPFGLTTGDGNDTGIDGIGILVNGTLVTDPDMLHDLAQASGFLDVDFIFVQAERSPAFNSAKIGQFGFGVLDFFSEHPKLERNQAISDAAEIMDLTYKTFSSKFHRRPFCHMYYVTTGTWNADQALVARVENAVEDLHGLAIFDNVQFRPIDASDIQRLYAQTKNAITREFTFATRTPIPEIPGVSEAYLGIIPAAAFLSLIEDNNGEVVKSVFYDNVRDFQGYNTVNDGMKETLQSKEMKSRFVLMNNGITIIAKKMRVTGNKIALEDYQIVNGCQTSHVLQLQKDTLDDSVMVPLRVIATDDEDVVASIIKATNRQTLVGEEQLLALSEAARVPWTLSTLWRRVHQWPRNILVPTPWSSGLSSSSWLARAGDRKIWQPSLNSPIKRSATGSDRPISMPISGRTA